ncbi:MAG: PA2169 family four-helix-bundle protein [Anaerolineae bacterium]
MVSPDDNSLPALTKLSTALEERSESMRKAAHVVESHNLQIIFNATAQRRLRYADMLRDEIDEHGAEPVDDADMEANLEQYWNEIEDNLTEDGLSTLLAEVTRGEKEILDMYQDFLSADLPADVKEVLEGQLDHLEEMYKALTDLHRKKT